MSGRVVSPGSILRGIPSCVGCASLVAAYLYWLLRHVGIVQSVLTQPKRQQHQHLHGSRKMMRRTFPRGWINKFRDCVRGDMNKAIKREHFPMKTIEEVVQNMPGAKVFSKLDATSGYWQLKTKKAPSCVRSTLHSDVIASFVFHLALSRQVKYFSEWCLRWSKTLREVKPSLMT